MSLFDEILDREIKEEDLEVPNVRELELFEQSSVWLWIRKLMILEQRQIITELIQGRAIGMEHKLDFPDMRFRQGMYQAIEKIISLVEVAKEDIKITNKQTKED